MKFTWLYEEYNGYAVWKLCRDGTVISSELFLVLRRGKKFTHHFGDRRYDDLSLAKYDVIQKYGILVTDKLV